MIKFKSMLFVLILLFSLTLPGVFAIAGTPHLIYGTLKNSDDSIPSNGTIKFEGYIKARPNEVLTESDAGCGYKDGTWWIEIGNFPSPWSVDEVLHITTTNTSSQEKNYGDIGLNNAGYQNRLLILAKQQSTDNEKGDAGDTSGCFISAASHNIADFQVSKFSHTFLNYELTGGFLLLLLLAFAAIRRKCSKIRIQDCLAKMLMGIIFFQFVFIMGNGGKAFASSITFELKAGLNCISVPFENTGLTNAEKLANNISGCDLVKYWDPSEQEYVEHQKGSDEYNFNIVAGNPYFVRVTADTSWSLSGTVLAHRNFQLIETAKTSVNAVSLPVGRTDLTNAESLRKEIPKCDTIWEWDPENQGYVGHPKDSTLNNFTLKPGYCYFANVTGDGTWTQVPLDDIDNDNDNFTENQDDCNDDDDTVYPGASESCNDNKDNDCDGKSDCDDSDCSEDAACQTCTDADTDNFFAQSGCGTDTDCNDNNSDIFPGATEICNDNKDNDCDGKTDCDDSDCSEDAACQTCTDADTDNFFAQSGCGTDTDCNDSDADIYPGATEVCNDAKDNDCDGKTDCADSDCSGYPACQTCTDADKDSFFAQSGCGTDTDCNDSDADIYPSATELCSDTKDNDCDGKTDCDDSDCNETPLCQGCTDADSDGYYAMESCSIGVDCNDNDKEIHPKATEICGDGTDQDCDGSDLPCGPAVSDTIPGNDVTGVEISANIFAIFSQDMTPWTINSDTFQVHTGTGDNLKTIQGTVSYSSGIAKFVPDSPLDYGTKYVGTVTTGAKNLAGNPLESDYVWSFTTVSEHDKDKDGYTAQQGDCNDDNADIHPEATEICNDNTDNDCDKIFDCEDPDCAGSSLCITCTDADSDGYYAESGCGTEPDCNDSDNGISPGTPEICNDGTDQDCDGSDLLCFPTVSSTIPNDNADDVGRHADISATFSRAMDPSTINSGTFHVQPDTGTPIQGTVSYVGMTATFIPNSLLEYYTKYMATVTTGAKDLEGKPLGSDFTWSFTTTAGNDKDNDGYTDIQGDCNDEDAGIHPGMTEICNDKTDNDCDDKTDCEDPYCTGDPECQQVCSDSDSDNFYAESNCGTLADCNDDDADIYPGATELCNDNKDNDCDEKTDCDDPDCSGNPACAVCTDADSDGYYAESDCGTLPDCNDNDDDVYPGATEKCGDEKDQDCNGRDLSCTVLPVVSSTNPGNNDTYVDVNVVISVIFSQVMDSQTVSKDTFYVRTGEAYGLQSVSGTVNCVGAAATFIPDSPLDYGKSYDAVITTGAKNPGGYSAAFDYEWSFTVMPIISSTVPSNNDTDVDVNTSVSVTFSKDLDPSSINIGTFYMTTGEEYGLITVPGTMTYGDKTAIFSPSSPLEHETVYEATVTKDVKDSQGNSLGQDYKWLFTTLKENSLASLTIDQGF